MSQNSIGKSIVIVTGFSVITRTLSFIFKIYLSRKLGAEAVGLYQICLSVFFLFASFSSSGLSTVLARKTAENRALDDKNNTLTEFSTALIIGITLSFFAIFALFIHKDFISPLFSDTRAIPLFLVMIPALLSTTVYCLIRSWFWGSKQYTYFSITELIEEILRIIFTILFTSGFVFGITGSYGIAIAFTFSDICVAILLTILFFIKGGNIVKPKNIKSIIEPSLPLTLMRVLGSMVGTFIAILLPQKLIECGYTISEATADFGRITGMANPLLFAPNAIISSLIIVLIPEISENSIKNNYSLLNKQLKSGIILSTTISALFLVIYLSMGEELTYLLYNDKNSGKYLQYSSVLLLLMPLNMILSSAINSIGKEKNNFISFILSTIFLILSIWFLPKYIGIYSVIVANTLSLSVSITTNIIALRKHIRLDLGCLYEVLKVSVFALISGFVTKYLFAILERQLGFFGIIIASIVGVVIYVLALLVFKIVEPEIIYKYTPPKIKHIFEKTVKKLSFFKNKFSKRNI